MKTRTGRRSLKNAKGGRRSRGAGVAAACAIGAVVAAIGCGGLSAGGGPAPPRVGGPREEVVLVGSYGEIVAMGASRRLLFAASDGGIAIHDRFSERWLPPLTIADGFEPARITTVSGDPERDVAWIGGLGEVLFFDPVLDQMSRAIVPGRVERIFFDRADPVGGAYVATAGMWSRVSPTGFAVPVAVSQLPPEGRLWRGVDLDDLYREFPSLQAFSTLLTRDESLRGFQPISGTRHPDRSDAWVGTLGGGVYLLDPLFNRARHVPYGLFERGASALAPAADGVWIGSEGRDGGGTGGVAATDAALQRWTWLRGPPDGSLGGLRVNDLLVVDGAVWVATARGVATRALGSSGSATRWEWLTLDGMPRAWALAPSLDGVWVGSDRGLASVRGGQARAVGTRAPVRALARAGDSLWAGTDAGLLVMPRSTGEGATALEQPVLAPTTNILDRRIVALARADTVLVAATEDGVALVDLRGRSARLAADGATTRSIAPVTAVAIDATSIWVGGAGGLLVVDRTTGGARVVQTRLPVGLPVHDVVVDDEMVWLATPQGVVRMRKRASVR